jgi:hypothetical protein
MAQPTAFSICAHAQLAVCQEINCSTVSEHAEAGKSGRAEQLFSRSISHSFTCLSEAVASYLLPTDANPNTKQPPPGTQAPARPPTLRLPNPIYNSPPSEPDNHGIRKSPPRQDKPGTSATPTNPRSALRHRLPCRTLISPALIGPCRQREQQQTVRPCPDQRLNYGRPPDLMEDLVHDKRRPHAVNFARCPRANR